VTAHTAGQTHTGLKVQEATAVLTKPVAGSDILYPTILTALSIPLPQSVYPFDLKPQSAQ
jgi:hypothetical protein